MKPYQQRVVDEKSELDGKREKLLTFFLSDVFSTLDDAEKHRLERQGLAMRDYSLVLGERIQAFT